MALHALTIHEAAARLERGEITSLALTEAVIEHILALDNDIQAYITLTPEAARATGQVDPARVSSFTFGDLANFHDPVTETATADATPTPMPAGCASMAGRWWRRR